MVIGDLLELEELEVDGLCPTPWLHLHLQLFFICTFFSLPNSYLNIIASSFFMDCLVPSSLRTGPSPLFLIGNKCD